MMDVAIIGAGGHGRVVLDVLRVAGIHRPVLFADANPALTGLRVDGLPVVTGSGMFHALRERGISGVFVAVGDNGTRRGYCEDAQREGFELVNAVHPSAQVSDTARLGSNVIVAAGSVVCAHCQVGDAAILNTGCIVDHESMIGTAAHVCPGVRLAGHVTIESGAFVGIGATVIQGIRVGFDAIVGAGAVVIRDVDPMTTVVGVPARSIKDAPSAAEFASLLQPPMLRGQAAATAIGPH
jgi:UDP-perosamine 4-acetyltransferase